MLSDEWKGSIPTGYNDVHRHRFLNGESREQREAWLERQLTNAGRVGIEVFCKETEEGYVFAFKEFSHFLNFCLNIGGDAKRKSGERVKMSFEEAVDPYWIKAAKMYLLHLGIDYDLRVEGNTVSFAFDRLSEAAVLRLMSDSGEIEHTARALERCDGFLESVRKFPADSAPSGNDGPGL